MTDSTLFSPLCLLFEGPGVFLGQDWSKNKCSQGSLFSTPPEHLFSGQYGTNLEPCGPILEPIVDFSAHLRAGNQPFCVKNKCSEGSLFSTPCEHLFSGQNRANLEPWGPMLEPTRAEEGSVCVFFDPFLPFGPLGAPWPSLGVYLPLHAHCTGLGWPQFSSLLGS